ncbi:MAG TPA: CocE/NonD family hydrolase, partial [Polyangiales bacterium]|nr:CocE/NonD family hydrolase [Polyangiales bacterium]
LRSDEMKKVHHPVFIVGGFFDIFAPDESRIASELPRHARDVSIVLGPWTHAGPAAMQGELVYPRDAALPSLDDEERAYFAWCLRGAARPVLPAVRYYLSELGEREHDKFAMRGEWRTSERWPPAQTHAVSLFLAPDHGLATQTAAGAPVALELDPSDPMPTRGGGNFSTPAGPFEQSELDRRRDVYVATTAPLTSPLELVGTPRAFVWAASTTDDLDVVVRFEQVTPDGEVVAFADGLRRGRFVQGDDAIRPLKPGEPTLFAVELGPIALRVREGSALRIAISGASSPRYEPNPNRALPLSTAAAPVAATLSLYLDPAHPSRLELPLLRGALPTGSPPRGILSHGWALLALVAGIVAAGVRFRRRKT